MSHNEFKYQFRRMCRKHPGCKGCPMDGISGSFERQSNAALSCNDHEELHSVVVEQVISRWAAEHPEVTSQ